MDLHIGTCGWQYRHWRGVLYPPGLPASRWLERYAEEFRAVEVDASFYRLPKPSVAAAWAERTPPDMRIAMKASRYLTHVRRLREPAEPVARFMAVASRLGAKLAAALLQLPPDMPAEPGRLDDTLARFPAGVRVAVEPRHESWWIPEVREVLERRGAALCLADRGGPVTPLWRTADWGYLRLHEGSGPDGPGYAFDDLMAWRTRLERMFGAGEEVLVFFNNDMGGWAVRDALAFRAGRPVEHEHMFD